MDLAHADLGMSLEEVWEVAAASTRHGPMDDRHRAILEAIVSAERVWAASLIEAVIGLIRAGHTDPAALLAQVGIWVQGAAQRPLERPGRPGGDVRGTTTSRVERPAVREGPGAPTSDPQPSASSSDPDIGLLLGPSSPDGSDYIIITDDEWDLLTGDDDDVL